MQALQQQATAVPARKETKKKDRNHELSLAKIMTLSETEVAELFARIRWASNEGEPFCPKCGCVSVYSFRTRAIWKCKACSCQFSVTSGTALGSRKLSLQVMLLGIVLFVSGAKGIASRQLGKMLDCQYRTAFSFAHRIREMLVQEQSEIPKLSRQVEIDGAFFGGHMERFNYVDKRTGRLHTRRRYGNRRIVIVIRQRDGRTLTHVVSKESEALPFIKDRVSSLSEVHVDLGHGWDGMQELYNLMRINHKESYSMGGACTNHAESFFALLRRKQMGIHHRMSGNKLHLYAAELAWRNDHKDKPAGELTWMLLNQLLTRPASGNWKNYGRKRKEEAEIMQCDKLAKELRKMALV